MKTQAWLKLAAGTALALIIGLFFFQPNDSPPLDTTKITKSEVTEDEATKDYFSKNKDNILLEANSAFEANDFQRVIALTSKYLITDDSEVVSLNRRAKQELIEITAAAERENKKQLLILNTQESINKLVSAPANFVDMQKEDLSIRIDEFNLAAKSLIQLKAFQLSEKEKSTLNKLKTSLSNKQAKDFPSLRKQLARRFSERMWEHNIDIRVLGPGGATIEYVGAYFADRGNIKEAFLDSHEVLNKFRFKQVRFKWNKYDDEYTYYKIDSLKDSVLPTD